MPIYHGIWYSYMAGNAVCSAAAAPCKECRFEKSLQYNVSFIPFAIDILLHCIASCGWVWVYWHIIMPKTFSYMGRNNNRVDSVQFLSLLAILFPYCCPPLHPTLIAKLHITSNYPTFMETAKSLTHVQTQTWGQKCHHLEPRQRRSRH